MSKRKSLNSINLTKIEEVNKNFINESRNYNIFSRPDETLDQSLVSNFSICDHEKEKFNSKNESRIFQSFQHKVNSHIEVTVSNQNNTTFTFTEMNRQVGNYLEVRK